MRRAAHDVANHAPRNSRDNPSRSALKVWIITRFWVSRQTRHKRKLKPHIDCVWQEYHPDKVAHLGPELRILAERKAKEINEAYRILSR